MTRNQTKLISAAITLALSVVMLAGASFAWFTLSVAPEITGMQVSLYTDIDLLVSKTQDGEFSQSITTESQDTPTKNTTIDDLPFYASLRPVSTVDGENWFRAEYRGDGEIDDVKNFKPLTSVNANVVLWEETLTGYSQPMTEGSTEYIEKERNSYYMYADVWLKTENQDGVNVTLSVPDITEGQSHDNGSMQAWELGDGSDYSDQHGKKYGSFALPKYVREDEQTYAIDNNVQTALRIGFLTEDGRFTVYEPNADQRSDATYKPREGQENEYAYIKGYELKEDASNYLSGYYIPTNPIGLVEDEETGEQVPGVVEMPQDRLLVQRGSSWNQSSILTNYANPTSADVYHFGRFITKTESLSKTGPTNMADCDQGLASENIIVTLRKDVPQKVRIFFWLEGQDVDCWNDIASGSFIVNLEFAAQPGKPEPLPEPTTEATTEPVTEATTAPSSEPTGPADPNT